MPASLPGWSKARQALPRGTLPVGGGLVLLGLTSYAFLVISARMLGPERYAGLSVLWAVVIAVGPGVFHPVEQEVARALADRRARGLGGGPVVRRAALLGGVAILLLLGLMALGTPRGLGDLLDDDVLLIAGLALSLVGYFAEHLLRGALAGHGFFGPYGTVLAVEGFVRLAGCVLLAGLGVRAAGPYGLLLGLAPLLAAGLAVRHRPALSGPGPEVGWGEVSRALGHLLAASLLAQLLVNAGPVAVKLLAAPGEEAEAGRFLAGLTIARVPLFLFAAVQASLLPRLAQLVGAGRLEAFRRELLRLVAGVAAVALAATVGVSLVGPWVVRLLFGASFVLSGFELALLAAASGAYMLALVLAQGLIALGGHERVGIGWGAGLLVFVVGTALGDGLVIRVGVGFVAGATAAAVAMGALVATRRRAGRVRSQTGFDVPIEP